ncbi:sporulation YhaL family protein [Evansella halocellulosilytica]|uniref:sporulation YhaL family protein n=1 Tax=Evansella halocellulosilytica TaxID=2011013 RepID=UPI000BB9B8FA|nr:sporulation YhaL family protein [Evansella halocellulosilytica]
MNPVKIIFSLIAAIFLIFVIRLLSLTSLSAEGGSGLPWWIYVVYIGILFSGIMYVHSRLEEKRREEKEIELEGSLFLEEFHRRRKMINNKNE